MDAGFDSQEMQDLALKSYQIWLSNNAKFGSSGMLGSTLQRLKGLSGEI
jgi:hypothetical protein